MFSLCSLPIEPLGWLFFHPTESKAVDAWHFAGQGRMDRSSSALSLLRTWPDQTRGGRHPPGARVGPLCPFIPPYVRGPFAGPGQGTAAGTGLTQPPLIDLGHATRWPRRQSRPQDADPPGALGSRIGVGGADDGTESHTICHLTPPLTQNPPHRHRHPTGHQPSKPRHAHAQPSQQQHSSSSSPAGSSSPSRELRAPLTLPPVL